VSEANNWSAVRLQLAGREEFGSVYPTYGFVYNRPDTGIVTASYVEPAPRPVLNPPPADLRPAAERGWHTAEEVAEAPYEAPHGTTHRTHHRRADTRYTQASLTH
jgi:hypothetical protein